MTGDTSGYFIKAGIGGASCAIAGSLLNPIDVVKIRMQNNSASFPWPEQNLMKGMARIYREDGVAGLCKGLNATIIREMLYSTIRMGAYEPILQGLSGNKDRQVVPSPAVKFFSALLSGGLGAAVANPTDLIKVQFQAALAGHKIPYTTTLGGFAYVYRNHGLAGLYKGCVVTTLRASIVTSACIGSYDTIKNNILKQYFDMEDGLGLFSVCSMLAGIITTTAANPVDVIKTRYMSDINGLYRNPLHCVVTTYKAEGMMAFFKGWTPAYLRIGPYTILAFVLMEQARLLLGFNTL